MKKLSLFRGYLLICCIALPVYTYAEYYGYLLLGSDEEKSDVNTAHGSGFQGARSHHK